MIGRTEVRSGMVGVGHESPVVNQPIDSGLDRVRSTAVFNLLQMITTCTSIIFPFEPSGVRTTFPVLPSVTPRVAGRVESGPRSLTSDEE